MTSDRFLLRLGSEDAPARLAGPVPVASALEFAPPRRIESFRRFDGKLRVSEYPKFAHELSTSVPSLSSVTNHADATDRICSFGGTAFRRHQEPHLIFLSFFVKINFRVL